MDISGDKGLCTVPYHRFHLLTPTSVWPPERWGGPCGLFMVVPYHHFLHVLFGICKHRDIFSMWLLTKGLKFHLGGHSFLFIHFLKRTQEAEASVLRCFFFFLIFSYWSERDRHLFVIPFIYAYMVDSCVCPDLGLNAQPWHTGWKSFYFSFKLTHSSPYLINPLVRDI